MPGISRKWGTAGDIRRPTPCARAVAPHAAAEAASPFGLRRRRCLSSGGSPPWIHFAGPRRIAMADPDDRLDVASHVEVPHDFAVAGFEERDQVTEDDVDHILVVDVPVAVPVDVQLQRLQLDASWPRHVTDMQGGEVGESRNRAEACEFGDGELDGVVAVRGAIVECRQPGLPDRAGPVQLLAHCSAPRNRARSEARGIGANLVSRSYVSTPSIRLSAVTNA